MILFTEPYCTFNLVFVLNPNTVMPRIQPWGSYSQKWGFLFEGRRGYSRGGVIKFYWAKLEGGFSRGGGILGEGLVESLQYVMTKLFTHFGQKN